MILLIGGLNMKLITRDELKDRLDNKDDFKLCMVLGEWQFQAKHIPGSIHVGNIEEGTNLLSKDDDIVVYCSNVSCVASIYAYRILVANGFANVRRYAGGVEDWEAAGYPLEGELVY